MQGVKQRTRKLFYQFSLDEHVAEDHPYRQIDEKLDLSFLYRRTADYYGSDGQESIDAVVFFKMGLLGYLNNIASDRALVRYREDSLSARWVIGYDIEESLPVHSTISRTRALFEESLYEEVFLAVLALCVDKGRVSGKRQVADSALIKANASLDSMQRKKVLEDASQYCQQTRDENPVEEGSPPQPADQPASASHSSEEKAPSVPEASLEAVEMTDSKASNPRRSNKTHSSSSDPDARMTCKPGKPTALYYRGQICADGGEGVITVAMADYGDREDPQALPQLLEKIQTHLSPHQMSAEQIIADSKYNTSRSLEACQKAAVTPYMPNPSGYKPKRSGFTYDPTADCYWCEQGIRLPFKGRQTNHGSYKNKVYKSKPSDCAGCPLAGECLSANSNYKTLTDSTGKGLYDRRHQRLQTQRGKYLTAKPKGIVEPVFGNLLWSYSMRKVYARGLSAADKHVKMAAAAYNLTKWLKKPAPGPFGKPAATEKLAFETISYFFPNLRAFYWLLLKFLSPIITIPPLQPQDYFLEFRVVQQTREGGLHRFHL